MKADIEIRARTRIATGAAEPTSLHRAATPVRIQQGPPPADVARKLAAVKTVHTAAWFSIEVCVLYVLYAGFARRSDRKALAAAAVVGGETLIFAGNGFRCPLTDVAESLGAEDGSVTDIYLPHWFAHNLPAIHVPLLLLAGTLHLRNLRQPPGRHGT